MHLWGEGEIQTQKKQKTDGQTERKVRSRRERNLSLFSFFAKNDLANFFFGAPKLLLH